MPSINMIASRRADKRRQEQNHRRLSYAVLGEIGIVLLTVSFMSLRLVSAGNRVNDLNDQLKSLAPKVAEIHRLQQGTDLLLPKVTTLDAAKSDTLFWYNNLYAITHSLPSATWLTSLSTTGASASDGSPGAASGADPTMSLQGIALNPATVGEAMLRMNSAPSLDHVELSFVQQQKIGTINTVTFQMTVHLKPEPSAVPIAGDQNAKKS